MTNKIFKFNGKEIEFIVNEKGNVMVNATQMAKVFKKYTKDYLKNEQTKFYLEECLKKENSPNINIETKTDLVYSKQKSGTWMHEVVALEFAAWLSPSFKFWVYTTIQSLIGYHSKKRTENLKKLAEMEKTRNTIINKLSKDSPMFRKYLELEKGIKSSKAKSSANTREEMNFYRQETLFQFGN